MWEYKHTDEIRHSKHKYIAKIGEGIKARYFYTQESLDAYKKALSSKDEVEKMQEVANGPGFKKEKVTIGDREVTIVSPKDEHALNELMKAKQDQLRASTLKGKAEDVAEVFNERNPETAKRIKRGKDFISGLFR